MGWMLDASWAVLLGLGLVYGFATAADAAVYSTGLTELAEARTMGSAQVLHTFFGYGPFASLLASRWASPRPGLGAVR